jgi:hypothetical protein
MPEKIRRIERMWSFEMACRTGCVKIGLLPQCNANDKQCLLYAL